MSTKENGTNKFWEDQKAIIAQVETEENVELKKVGITIKQNANGTFSIRGLSYDFK